MATKRPWAAPGFTVLALLALSACSGGGGSSGSPGGTPVSSGGDSVSPPPPPPPPPVAAANPYAADGDTQASKLGNLAVFGDSYSSPNAANRPGVRVWNQ